MADKKTCFGCKEEIATFKLIVNDDDGPDEGKVELYCGDCMANIVRDAPGAIRAITPLEGE